MCGILYHSRLGNKTERQPPLPDDVSKIIQLVGRRRDSPEPSPDDVLRDRGLQQLKEDGLGKSGVSTYFEEEFFPHITSDTEPPHHGIQLGIGQPICDFHVPTIPKCGSELCITATDLIYGYHRSTAFPQQQKQVWRLGSQALANGLLVIYPFLVVEIVGDGGDDRERL